MTQSVYANADAALIRGIDQIKPWYEQAFQNIEGKLHHKEEAAFIEGNMALLLGRITSNRKPVWPRLRMHI